MNASSPRPWLRELGARFCQLFWLKSVGITAWVWLFFIGYFHILRHPAYPVTVMPLTWLDQTLPFQPAALVPYLSLWIYVGVAPALQRGFWQLFAYGFWAGLLSLSGLVFFYFWPTQIPPMAIDISAPGFALLHGIDAAGNACPSMHVAGSVFSAIRLAEVLRTVRAPNWSQALNLLWAAAITYSTLAVKQHVLLDVLAGAALGALIGWASLRWRPRV